MSSYPDLEPVCRHASDPDVELVIDARPRDLGGFTVRRLLPAVERRNVGPFVFFDHMGPADFPPGSGIDVRPHPHIGLATVTYLFAGELVHKDSLGSDLPIRPGAVNLMIAGRGVVHSERSSAAWRETGGHLDGVQAWVALPAADEEMAPAFEHHPAATLPTLTPFPGVRMRVLAGEAYGARAPVGVRSPTLYVEAHLDAGATLPVPTEHVERAVYVVAGTVEVDGATYEVGRLLVLRVGSAPVLRAPAGAHVVLLGGAPLDGPRFIWWNLVSSRPERIDEAAADWRAQRFPKVPGDEVEFTPAPDGPPRFSR